MSYGKALAIPICKTGVYMKTNTGALIKVTALIALALLTSCGTSKSTATSSGTDLSSRVEVDSSKPLASCNLLSKSGFLTMNIANVIGSDGKADQQWVKIKFPNIDSSLNQPAYFVQLYKWRVINNSTQLDSTPLQETAYSLASGQSTSVPDTGMYVKDMTSQTGFMVNLRDDVNNPYQVIKVVAYKSDGTVIDQVNVLIPQFLANPKDYKLNPDGTPRADLLQQLHPLHNTDVTSWSSSQIQSNFDQYCF